MINYTHPNRHPEQTQVQVEPVRLEPAQGRRWRIEERLLIRTANDLLSANLNGTMSWSFLYRWLERIESEFPELTTNIRKYWSNF